MQSSYFLVHKASTFIYGHRIYGDGIIVLPDTFERSEEKAQLAETTKDVAWHMQVSTTIMHTFP
jgi:hypothetical protein